MGDVLDPTFYRSASEAASAPPERLAYVVAFDSRVEIRVTVLRVPVPVVALSARVWPLGARPPSSAMN